MKKYFIKTPWWLKRVYPNYIWNMPVKEKKLYLTFDDGPHERATPFVLDELKKVNAKATFFCIGKNVKAQPELYSRILEEGHAVGNHTMHHLNGWKTEDKIYLNDIAEAAKHIDAALFRPPYGRIRSFQAKHLPSVIQHSPAIIMWDVLSADFDTELKGEDCLKNVIMNATNGSIIVFHDSEKAFQRLEYALPRVLKYYGEKGFSFEKLVNGGWKITSGDKMLAAG